MANNDVESSKLMNNLLKDVCSRFYSTISQQTIDFCIDFLALQKDFYKLIELFSMRYFQRLGKNE